MRVICLIAFLFSPLASSRAEDKNALLEARVRAAALRAALERTQAPTSPTTSPTTPEKKSPYDARSTGILNKVIEDLHLHYDLRELDKELAELHLGITDTIGEGKMDFYIAPTLQNARVGCVTWLKYYRSEDGATHGPYIKVLQVLNLTNALVEFHASDNAKAEALEHPTFLLHGVETSKYADNDKIRFHGIFYIAATKQLKTASGVLRTVKVVRPYDYKSMAEQYDADVARAQRDSERAAAKAEEAAKERAVSFRKWEPADGVPTAEARIARYANGTIVLEERSGKTHKVSVDKLADADKEYFEQWKKKHQ
jgi:hypothetical protein